MKISDDGMPQPNAKNVFGFAHLLSAQDFAQRGPLEIVLAGDKLATTAVGDWFNVGGALSYCGQFDGAWR
jgi:hypothetical protein